MKIVVTGVLNFSPDQTFNVCDAPYSLYFHTNFLQVCKSVVRTFLINAM